MTSWLGSGGAMDSGQLQRVQTISDLIRRSNAAAEENTESANGIAISLLHDAIEHSLYFVLLDTDQNAKPREEFKSLLGDVAKVFEGKVGEALPFQRKLHVLNNHRVAFKHHGTRPTRSTTLEAMSYGTEFVTVLFGKVYKFQIDKFHPAEFLRIEEIRSLLISVPALAETGEIDDAMTKLAIANYRVEQAFSAVFDQPRPPMSLTSPFDSGRNFRQDLVEYISRSDKHTLVTAVLVASGQDVAAYTSMRWRLPVVYALIDGSFRFDKIVPAPYTSEDARFCLEQISRISVWLEERFPLLDFKDGRWVTGAVSPWPN
jgi:hypothetical protein